MNGSPERFKRLFRSSSDRLRASTATLAQQERIIEVMAEAEEAAMETAGRMNPLTRSGKCVPAGDLCRHPERLSNHLFIARLVGFGHGPGLTAERQRLT